MWVLRESGQEDGLTFRITKGSVKTLGRAPRADFIVDASLVSRLHCRLTVRPDGTLEIKDLDSTNGTYVNGRKVDRADLRDGDEIGIGRIKMKVEQVH
jgi:pSer/pThr/pTyr-binding forkhead associated (FHA) protein